MTDKNIIKQYNKVVRPFKRAFLEDWTVNKHQSFTLSRMVENCKYLLEELDYYKAWCLEKKFTEPEYNEVVLSLNTFVAQYKALI